MDSEQGSWDSSSPSLPITPLPCRFLKGFYPKDHFYSHNLKLKYFEAILFSWKLSWDLTTLGSDSWRVEVEGREEQGRQVCVKDPGLTDPPAKLGEGEGREGEGRSPGPVEVSRPFRSSREGGRKVKHG